jgi:acetyl-CoA/propionyl-CoA carboxylase biotin carboxyl carrier protein
MVRALTEFDVGGVRTTIPAHLALLQTDDFRAVNHSTKWVEDEVDHATFASAADTRVLVVPPAEDGDSALVERTVPVEVDGRRYTVKVFLPDQPAAAAPAGTGARTKPRPAAASRTGGSGSGTITAPMQGTIVKVLVEAGAQVEAGQAILVLEAMKMENQINAETSGTVKEIRVAAGDSVGTGDVLAVIE